MKKATLYFLTLMTALYSCNTTSSKYQMKNEAGENLKLELRITKSSYINGKDAETGKTHYIEYQDSALITTNPSTNKRIIYLHLDTFGNTVNKITSQNTNNETQKECWRGENKELTDTIFDFEKADKDWRKKINYIKQEEKEKEMLQKNELDIIRK